MYYSFSFWATVVTIAVIMGAIQGMCAYMILLERKISAWVQDRLGPNRVGPGGLLQPLADGLKFILKEEIIPTHVDRVFYMIAPAIAVGTALLAFAVVPFGPTTAPPHPLDANYQQKLDEYQNTYQFVIAPHVDIGILFVFAVSSLAVYGIILGGWSSNNKYSLLGAMRSSAQIISYEIPMGTSVLSLVLLAKSLNLEELIQAQVDGVWFICYQPLACVLFITSIFAECNRLPFDLPECEQELVGGYHTEYSGMKFALFFLGEYTHMITTSFLAVLLFFGGWHLPGLTGSHIVIQVLVFALKMGLFIVFYMLIRWTLPRFRFDQLMSLAWKVLIPLSLLNFVGVMVLVHLIENAGWSPASKWLLLPYSLGLLVLSGVVALKQPKAVSQKVVVVRGHERVEVTV